jgi:hypothetical protein
MSLTQDDLLQIRTIMKETIRPLENKVDALYNDVKELYEITMKLETDCCVGEAGS